ncbi:MAG: branched-chain amino acid ABC transporter permease [Desulfomonile tiedjei]|uniref:Branched-chain amino acid ABC transporter permease n=1 Tax=Desulfomonile tiedjei TaxID=2358 RepID=A0A9D6UYM8_9BACT|nr:branched-chain amino acid ABC transporter permease [Desulfomonile tiedjei]
MSVQVKGTKLFLVMAAVLFFISPLFLSRYAIYVLNLFAIYALVAIGLNLVMGYTGLISAGHAGFLAIGAYSTAILTSVAGWLSPLIILHVAGLLTGLIGFGLGIPILRLKGIYIVMVTLAFGVVITEIILQWSSLTHGDDGFRVPRAVLGGFVFDSDKKLFFLIQPITIVMTLIARNIVQTRVGRAFRAIEQSEIASETMGIDLAKYKTKAFGLSAFYTGIAGGLFAYAMTYISPDSFNMGVSIDFIAMIVIGGMGSILGSIIGAVILTGIQHALSELPKVQTLIFGIALIVFMIFMPKGISGLIMDWKQGGPNRKQSQ